MKKLLFFDIDGTLIPYRGEVPDSAREALLRAREEGCGLVLCTGRSECLIPGKLMDLGFDGIISATGATISWKGEFVRMVSMGEKAEKLIRILEENQLFYTLQTPQMAYSPREMEAQARAAGFGKLGIQFVDIRQEAERFRSTEKAVVASKTITMPQLQTLLGPDFVVEPGSFDPSDPYSGEVTMAGVHKDTAMAWLGEYLGVSREDMIAFGDGPNDPDMLRFAGIGVAMGNAVPEAKAAADMVTASVEEDGVYKALAKLLNWE